MPSVNGDVALITASALNQGNLDELVQALRRHSGIIPFVGAGLSRPWGFPEWGDFLRLQAETVDAKSTIDVRLAKGEYEEAAEDLQKALGDLAFEDAIRRTFGSQKIKGLHLDAAVRALPALATGPVLTTNFDRVLESVFEEADVPFEEVFSGAMPGRVVEALHVNSIVLWKIHGDFKSQSDRVLTTSEYAQHYGHSDPAQFDWQRPLPRLFDNLLAARPVLFLGSRLQQDRTVRILAAFARRHPGVGHYALLSDPGDDHRHVRARELSNVGIRPLWYPAGRHDLIGPFLNFLAERQTGSGDRVGIDSQRVRIERGIEEQQRAIADSAAPATPDRQRVVGDPPDRTERFRGRATRLREVGEHLNSPSARLVSLVGPSGIGKTALAVRLLKDLEEYRWPPGVVGRKVDGIAYLSTRTEGIAFERLYFACARMLGGSARTELERDWKKEHLRADEKVQLLLEKMQKGLYVILLDHVEDLLDGHGKIADEDIRTLVDRSLASHGGPRLIVTSRSRLTLSREAAKLNRPVELSEGLPVEDGIEMLRDLDRASGLKELPDDVLERVVTRLHGVPRALEVFAGILADDVTVTVDQLLERFYNRADVVDDLFKEGINRLDETSQRVVEAFAVIGQPVPSAAIDFLLQPFVPGLDLPATLPRLSRGQIVRVADRARGTWALHPIDQDFAYARCPETGRYSRQALHHRAAEWYASIRPPRDKWGTLEGLDPLLREFDHRVKAGLYDDAAAVLAEFDDHFRGRLGHATRSLGMHLQVKDRITIDRVRMLDMLGLAHAYRHVSTLDDAIACYQKSLEMARTQQNVWVEIESLGWTGETLRRLTRLDESVEMVRQAVDVARRANDVTSVARWLGELALQHCYRGEMKEALDAAEEAHRIAVEIRDVDSQALAIDALTLAHLARGEAAKTIQVGERAIELYKQGSFENTVIYVLNVMGLAYLDLQQIDRAIECLDRAWRDARNYEDIRVEGMTRFNLAHAYRLVPDIEKALEMAEDAVRTFTKTGGGELPAAQALADALRARRAGITTAEARSLVAAARASLSNPDLRHPRDILNDAVRLARDAGAMEIAADAEQLLAAMAPRGEAESAADNGRAKPSDVQLNVAGIRDKTVRDKGTTSRHGSASHSEQSASRVPPLPVKSEVVVLIHGIRTAAPWAEMVASQLRTEQRKVLPIRYGYFDALRFLLPIGTRNGPVRRVLRELRAVREEDGHAQVSAIAHSFGTFALTRILEEDPIRLHHVVMCGSIIPSSFRWDLVKPRLTGHVVNECGTRDIWPILATSVTWGYGPSGNLGTGSTSVRDRFHDLPHSGFFTKEFVQEYWRPIFDEGVVAESKWEVSRPTPPYWHNVLLLLPIKWLILGLVVLAALIAGRAAVQTM